MHIAEHILNQTMVQLFKCERSFSNHIECKKSKCDYNFHKVLSSLDIKKINTKVNEIIKQNQEVVEEIITFEEANNLYDLGKIPD